MPQVLNVILKLGTLAMLVILVLVAIMLVISIADRYARPQTSHKKRDKCK